LRHRGLSDRDAFLASYPKSGNTWVKFMLAQLLTGATADFDSVERVIPDIGGHRDLPRLLPEGARLIKTHEPRRPPWGRYYKRAIYIVRDGRDVAVSYYFSMLRTGLYEGEFPGFLERFLEGDIGGFGPWHDHVASWLDGAGDTLIVRYEGLLDDATLEMKRIADHLGLSASAEALDRIVADNTADAMRGRESGTRIERERVRSDISFVRKASSGDWAEHLDGAAQERFWSVAGAAMQLAGYGPE
jgi:hypothetical protein